MEIKKATFPLNSYHLSLVTGEVDASQVDEDGFIIVNQPSPSQTRRGNDSFYSSDSEEDEEGLNRKLYAGATPRLPSCHVSFT